jgi:hypothetical protein
MALYSAVWSQCSLAMQERLEGLDNFSSISDPSDGIELLRAIKTASYNFVDTTYIVDSVNTAIIDLFTLKQTQYMTTAEYYKQFITRRDVYEQVGGGKDAPSGVLELIANLNKTTVTELSPQQRAAARDR